MASVPYLSHLVCFCWVISRVSAQDAECLWPETCETLSRCPIALQRLKDGLPINLCGYHLLQPTVCCFKGISYTPTNRSRTSDSTETEIDATSTSKSEAMCRQYGRSVFQFRPPSELIGGSKPENVSLCGLPSATPLIVGGDKALPREFPHMAAVGYGAQSYIRWQCGGALISERFVLTAAHCVIDLTPRGLGGLGRANWVRVGDLDLYSDADGVIPQQFHVVEWIRHPEFRDPQKYNDIGLLKLDRNVQFNEYVRPACLHRTRKVPGGRGTATGWGDTSKAGGPSSTLMKVSLPLVSQQYCNSSLSPNVISNYGRYLPLGIVDTMLCAGEMKGGKDTCKGDSGGPLQILLDTPHCMYSIIGVTSFGRSCAEPDTPGVYTRVSSFLPWLQQIVWP